MRPERRFRTQTHLSGEETQLREVGGLAQSHRSEYVLPAAAVTNHHKPGGSERQKLIL